MKIIKAIFILLCIGALGFLAWMFIQKKTSITYESPATSTPIVVAPQIPKPSASSMQTYTDKLFTIQYPTGYAVDTSYTYTNLGPNKTITGVKFTIPESFTTHTNLATDSYVSVEQVSQKTCSASLFLENVKAVDVTENGVAYSVASTTGAGAGNRYEETVYTLKTSNPCIAVRYMVHYGVLENYPQGTVAEFDRAGLLSQFDVVRKALVLKSSSTGKTQ